MVKQPTNRLHALWPIATSANDESFAAPFDAERLAAKIEPVFANVGTAIAEHPRTSLTMAAILGASIGWFIKRT